MTLIVADFLPDLRQSAASAFYAYRLRHGPERAFASGRIRIRRCCTTRLIALWLMPVSVI